MTYSVKEFDDRIEIRNPDGDVIRTEDKPFPVSSRERDLSILGDAFDEQQVEAIISVIRGPADDNS